MSNLSPRDVANSPTPITLAFLNRERFNTFQLREIILLREITMRRLQLEWANAVKDDTVNDFLRERITLLTDETASGKLILHLEDRVLNLQKINASLHYEITKLRRKPKTI